MARLLRIECPGAFYHITSRYNERMIFYENNFFLKNGDLRPDTACLLDLHIRAKPCDKLLSYSAACLLCNGLLINQSVMDSPLINCPLYICAAIIQVLNASIMTVGLFRIFLGAGLRNAGLQRSGKAVPGVYLICKGFFTCQI